MSERSEVERGLKGSGSDAASKPPAPGSALILRLVLGSALREESEDGGEEPKRWEERRK